VLARDEASRCSYTERERAAFHLVMTVARVDSRRIAGRRSTIWSADSILYGGATLSTLVAAYTAVVVGVHVAFDVLLALSLFGACLLGFLFAPHIVAAVMIPVFAFIPAAKLFVTPLIGPVKDLVTLAAAVATIAVIVLRPRMGRGHDFRDRWLMVIVALLLALYVIDAGGGHGVAWAQGVRLTAEPLILLMAGLTLAGDERVLRWTAASLIATACVLAGYGLIQQAVGPWTLAGWGYSFGEQLRTYNGHLRSFSTLDDPFAYAALLLFGLAAVFFWMRRGFLATLVAALIVGGLVASFVRTATLVLVALAGLWLARKKLSTTAMFATAAGVLAIAILLLVGAGATETRTYSSATSNLTLNGRITAWRVALGSPSEWPFGRGVGRVGTAAYRASFALSPRAPTVPQAAQSVDSGYLATVADVGLVGAAVLLALFARLAVLAWRRTRFGEPAGWLALGLITVMMLDALTRSSFTGFPTAFLGLFIIGAALAARPARSG
jgi:O-antigen ligase